MTHYLQNAVLAAAVRLISRQWLGYLKFPSMDSARCAGGFFTTETQNRLWLILFVPVVGLTYKTETSIYTFKIYRTMSDNYDYINTRICAMKSFLLKKSNYEELLNARDFNTLYLLLENVPSYSRDIKELQIHTGQSNQTLQNSLRLNLTRNIRKILHFCSGRPQYLLLFILHRWDIYNLKIVIRGIKNKWSAENILHSILCFGEWDTDFINILVHQSSLQNIIAKLKTRLKIWDTNIFTVLSSEKKQIKDIERELDFGYYQYCTTRLNTDDPQEYQILDIIQSEIDLKNILYAIKKTAVHKRIKETELIPGGRITPSFITKTAGEDSDISDILTKTGQPWYTRLFNEAADIYRSTESIIRIETFFRKFFLIKGIDLFRKSVCGIGTAIGYLFMKEIEIANLRILAAGFYYNVYPEFIQEALILQ